MRRAGGSLTPYSSGGAGPVDPPEWPCPLHGGRPGGGSGPPDGGETSPVPHRQCLDEDIRLDFDLPARSSTWRSRPSDQGHPRRTGAPPRCRDRVDAILDMRNDAACPRLRPAPPVEGSPRARGMVTLHAVRRGRSVSTNLDRAAASRPRWHVRRPLLRRPSRCADRLDRCWRSWTPGAVAGCRREVASTASAWFAYLLPGGTVRPRRTV